ncbi:MAG: roadblock/LC7 domain-containing protein [Betaproteobacteria bacterium]|jgi:predicted regulator of Ras-like GTPase activity (Roadblock/LC7/MglB family)|nr:MAG: roadblock/LC7 domain-containing protein [Burkholderiales bacterium]MBI3149590.1 roadblock/LC7 domain-containing protein [Betaproteobacteria bacterium]
MDSLALGKYFLPAMEQLATRVPQLQCAVMCTPDGFNVCSLGLNEERVGKMAALCSSLFSVGEAAATSVQSSATEAGGLQIMTIEAGGLQIGCTKIAHSSASFILLAAARAPLGVVLVGLKATAADLLGLVSSARLSPSGGR